jgi:hypothetical protein
MNLTSRVLCTAFAALVVIGCATGDPDAASDASTGGVDGPPASEPDAAGCGTACDEDGDGVPDENDQCPGTPAGEPVNQVGCADSQLTPTLEPEFPPFGLTWGNTGDLGRPGGLTWTYTAIQRSDLFHIYWILCDDPETPCGISLDGPLDTPTEHWQFSPADSDLANGTLVFTSTPQILLHDSSTLPLSGRLTVAITNLEGAPLPAADVTTLGITSRTGEAGAEIPATSFRVNMLAEVQDAQTMTWTPYLDYHDAAPTPDTGDTTYMSISGYFYSK